MGLAWVDTVKLTTRDFCSLNDVGSFIIRQEEGVVVAGATARATWAGAACPDRSSDRCRAAQPPFGRLRAAGAVRVRQADAFGPVSDGLADAKVSLDGGEGGRFGFLLPWAGRRPALAGGCRWDDCGTGMD